MFQTHGSDGTCYHVFVGAGYAENLQQTPKDQRRPSVFFQKTGGVPIDYKRTGLSFSAYFFTPLAFLIKALSMSSWCIFTWLLFGKIIEHAGTFDQKLCIFAPSGDR